jgi:hypothetical protein
MGRGREHCARMGFFLLVARVGRGRGRCARIGFFVGCKSGEQKRALGGRGYLWPKEPIQPLLKKLLPKILE